MLLKVDVYHRDMNDYQAVVKALARVPEKERKALIRSVVRASSKKMTPAERWTIEDCVTELRLRHRDLDQDTALEAVFLASMYLDVAASAPSRTDAVYADKRGKLCSVEGAEPGTPAQA